MLSSLFVPFLPVSIFFSKNNPLLSLTMKDETTAPEERLEYEIDEKKFSEKHEQDEQVEIQDEKPLHEEFVEEYQFTWRASIIGSLLGCLVGK